MKLHTISGQMVLAGLLTIVLCFTCLTVGSTSWAMIPFPSDCLDCHAGGGAMKTEYAGNQGCINCHSSSSRSATYTLNPEDAPYDVNPEIIVPVVVYTGASLGENDPILDGGNFWWVKGPAGDPPNDWTGGQDDTKGHNIFSGEPDSNLSAAPFDATSCGTAGPFCHVSLAATTFTVGGMRQGCTNCHMVDPGGGAYGFTTGFHHADDSDTVVGSATGDTDGFFRYLTGHQQGSGHGVCGIEDADWQSTSLTDHSEYLGREVDLNDTGSLRVGITNDPDNHTMTFFCSGCHGNKHISSASAGGGDWIRHPSGAGPLDSAYTEYSPRVPVSRPDLTGWTVPSSTVTPVTDMVMCLSCHRAHGSPYPKMLRWETVGGCDDCHKGAIQCP